jgi:hypothetical protein
MVVAGFLVLSSQRSVGRNDRVVKRNNPVDEEWKNHPALEEPDGRSHRGDKMVAADIDDPRILLELSRRFRQTKPLQLVQQSDKPTVQGFGNFERRQEYLLRLLDYYWFSKPRVLGMTGAQVEGIFGPLESKDGRDCISGGRDTVYFSFKNGRVSYVFYAMGY